MRQVAALITLLVAGEVTADKDQGELILDI